MGSSDIFSSSYGPGVIGTAAAIFVLLGFGGLYVFVFDKSLQGGGERIEVTIAEDAKAIEHTRKAITSATEKLARAEGFKDVLAKIQRIGVTSASLEVRIKDLEARVEAENGAIAGVETGFADYRRKYRESARAAMVGKTYDELRTTDGKVYQNVKVTEVDPLRMSIRHTGGITGVDLVNLPAEMQDFLQIDKEEREAHKDVEVTVTKTMKHGAEIAALQEKIGNLQYERGEAQRKVDMANAALDRSVQGIPMIESQIEAKQRELIAERAKANTGGISRAPAVEGEIRSLERRLLDARAMVPELRKRASDGEQAVRELDEQIAALRAKIVELGKAPGEPQPK